jgi:hypothetical protein
MLFGLGFYPKPLPIRRLPPPLSGGRRVIRREFANSFAKGRFVDTLRDSPYNTFSL